MRFLYASLLLPALLSAAPTARAHAFLDHASPGVGSTLRQAPATISLWFTQELEPAFSTVSIVDQGGQRVDHVHLPRRRMIMAERRSTRCRP